MNCQILGAGGKPSTFLTAGELVELPDNIVWKKLRERLVFQPKRFQTSQDDSKKKQIVSQSSSSIKPNSDL
eukprot:6935763-Pyramimonas_sp.AAC.1